MCIRSAGTRAAHVPELPCVPTHLLLCSIEGKGPFRAQVNIMLKVSRHGMDNARPLLLPSVTEKYTCTRARSDRGVRLRAHRAEDKTSHAIFSPRISKERSSSLEEPTREFSNKCGGSQTMKKRERERAASLLSELRQKCAVKKFPYRFRARRAYENP